MKSLTSLRVLLPAIFLIAASCNADTHSTVTVVSYYFGNYHPGDPRNVKTKGPDWSEWELVRNAKPRFPGHQQPHVPLWGYTDESKPEVMAQKIAAAADHGIGAFIFDWYYYNDGPFLDSPIDRGFLQATNNGRLKFAFMWANHDWLDIQPCHRGAPPKLLYPGQVTPATFRKICDHLIKDYFVRANYWRVEGKPYFSFYDLQNLVDSFGSVQATRAALDEFRARAKAAGLPGLHLNAVVWGQTILPGEKNVADPVKLVHDLGFDSVTSYVWIHHVALPYQQTEYNFVRDRYFDYWSRAATNFGVPYIPNVTMGWDPSPRADQSQPFDNSGYPFMNTITDNTPENFCIALELAKRRLLAEPGGLRILNLNCWNEWTEGSYLEPDAVHGMAYLDAVKQVFGAPAASSASISHPGPSGTSLIPVTQVVPYGDRRPAAKYRLDARDTGPVFEHGAGPNQCDYLGARDVWAWESGGTYFMHYDGAGLKGWLACLATSTNLTNWTAHGPVLDFGAANEEDSASASYGTTFFDGRIWRMFYLATRRASPAPDFIPMVPYATMEARSGSPWGPWKKQPGIRPVSCRPGTYYSDTACPAQIVKHGDEYMMFFSAAASHQGKLLRTLGIARTKNLDGIWRIDPQPIVPSSEQIENSSMYFQPSNQTWFLFSNHVGIENGNEFTDAIWVYWTRDLNRWNPANKAVVLDGRNCTWSHKCIGLPSVLKVGNRLAVFYDAPGGDSTSHMNRDVGLAWLSLPLNVPE